MKQEIVNTVHDSEQTTVVMKQVSDTEINPKKFRCPANNWRYTEGCFMLKSVRQGVTDLLFNST